MRLWTRLRTVSCSSAGSAASAAPADQGRHALERADIGALVKFHAAARDSERVKLPELAEGGAHLFFRQVEPRGALGHRQAGHSGRAGQKLHFRRPLGGEGLAELGQADRLDDLLAHHRDDLFAQQPLNRAAELAFLQARLAPHLLFLGLASLGTGSKHPDLEGMKAACQGLYVHACSWNRAARAARTCRRPCRARNNLTTLVGRRPGRNTGERRPRAALRASSGRPCSKNGRFEHLAPPSRLPRAARVPKKP
jgi:hypothetical protein